MRTRTFHRRKKQVTVDEHDECVAVYDPGMSPRKAVCQVAVADARAFQNAGWRIVERTRAEEFRGKPVAQVFARGERLLLALGRIVAKFSDDVTSDCIEAILSSHELQVQESLPFAKNLFVVAPLGAEPVDVIDVVDSLARLEQCEFAEPEFIEAIGARPIGDTSTPPQIHR